MTRPVSAKRQGNILKGIRQTLDASMVEIADLLYVTDRSWRRWENGEQEIGNVHIHFLLLVAHKHLVRAGWNPAHIARDFGISLG